MNDNELIGYCNIHCETDLALFHKNHVRRMFELAGEPVPVNIDEQDFWSVGPDLMRPLVKKAREGLR